jgi:hypothetical protein
VSPGRRQPLTAPPGLWERPEMAKALADRDLGAVSEIFRKRTGASQTDVGMPQPHISDIEHGKRLVTSLDLFERFAEGLGIPRHLLGLADASGGHSNPAGSAGANYRAGETDEKVVASHQQWLETRRKLNLNRAQHSKIASGLYPPLGTARLHRHPHARELATARAR